MSPTIAEPEVTTPETPPAPTGPKKYSRKRRTEDVTIEQEDGTEEEFEYVELLGPEREEFLERQSRSVNINAQGQVTGINTIKGLVPYLIAKSLRRKNEKKAYVTEAELRTWPGELQERVFLDCLRISGLDKGAQEAAKKASPEKS